MLNPEFKAKWLPALRSGEYQQGRGALRKKSVIAGGKDGFCCLGVACDVYDPTKWKPRESTLALTYVTEVDEGDAYLPKSVAEELGLGNEAQMQLAGMNDAGRSFNEIADYVEKNL